MFWSCSPRCVKAKKRLLRTACCGYRCRPFFTLHTKAQRHGVWSRYTEPRHIRMLQRKSVSSSIGSCPQIYLKHSSSVENGVCQMTMIRRREKSHHGHLTQPVLHPRAVLQIDLRARANGATHALSLELAYVPRLRTLAPDAVALCFGVEGEKFPTICALRSPSAVSLLSHETHHRGLQSQHTKERYEHSIQERALVGLHDGVPLHQLLGKGRRVGNERA